MKRCWDWGEDVSRGVCSCCWLCLDVPFRAQLSTSGPSWENERFRLTAQKWDSVLNPAITLGNQPFQHDTCCKHQDSSRINQRKVRASVTAQVGRSTGAPATGERKKTTHTVFGKSSHIGTPQVWGNNLKLQYHWAHRLSRNLEPKLLGWLCGIRFMWNTLQTVPFRTIIAFLRTIMYYVWCIIYSGGYWFIKESWANRQVIVWTVVMSNNKGYNLHSYSVFKLMSYPVWNPALGFLFLCFLILENTAWVYNLPLRYVAP